MRNGNEEEFELSVGSVGLLEKEQTQLQEISGKMSEKEPFEVLEEED